MVTTILVAGATGFVGSHVVEALVKSGYNIVVLKRSTSSTQRIDSVLDNVVTADTDKDNLDDIFSRHHIDVVINFVTEYGRGKDTPLSSLCQTNIMLPLQLIEAAKAHHVPYYWNVDSYWNTESSPAESISFYAYTKKVIKEILQFGFTDTMQVFNLKLFHPFGPKDDTKKFLPMVLGKLLNNEELGMTEGTQKLDFIYIKEVANIFTFLLANIDKFKQPFEHFDIGTGTSTPLRDVVEKMYKLTASQSKLTYGVIPLRKNEIMLAQAKPERLIEAGYKFQYTLDEALQEWIEREKHY
jgi:nucleoside-diphosphate-sugar epimerase